MKISLLFLLFSLHAAAEGFLEVPIGASRGNDPTQAPPTARNGLAGLNWERPTPADLGQVPMVFPPNSTDRRVLEDALIKQFQSMREQQIKALVRQVARDANRRIPCLEEDSALGLEKALTQANEYRVSCFAGRENITHVLQFRVRSTTAPEGCGSDTQIRALFDSSSTYHPQMALGLWNILLSQCRMNAEPVRVNHDAAVASSAQQYVTYQAPTAAWINETLQSDRYSNLRSILGLQNPAVSTEDRPKVDVPRVTFGNPNNPVGPPRDRSGSRPGN